MGGGKSRALCERALDLAIEWPGVPILIGRQSYASIKLTTKKTFFEEVIPADWLDACVAKASMGEDWVLFPNGSIIHFAGLDNPVRWFSAQLGVFMVDQVEECDEDTIVKIITRLRHPCSPVGRNPLTPGYQAQAGQPVAGKAYLSFNPANPGHWLQRWFLMGGMSVEYGTRKDELYTTDADRPLGDAEFFKALATDNPSLPPGYVEQTLAALPPHLRRRYLDGAWEYMTGTCHFDVNALQWYAEEGLEQPLYRFDFVGVPPGKARFSKHDNGRIAVFREPRPDGQYAIGADVATGRGKDYSAAYVIDLSNMELAAEFHGKLDEDLYAEQLHFLGRWFNTARIAVEKAGGYGDAVMIPLRDGKAGRPAYPRLHRHVLENRPDRPETKPFGFQMNAQTRPLVISGLEKAIRERSLPWLSNQLLVECQTFVEQDTLPSPRAQDGCNDDCVMAAAIAVEMYRKYGAHPERRRRPVRRRRVAAYPWQRVAA